MCCFSCFLNLRCVQCLLFWLQTCFPLRVNSVFAASWLHLGSVICLLLAASLSHAAHPRDLAYNKNMNKDQEYFENVSQSFLSITNKKIELDYLVSRWDGMFEDARPRGELQPIFMIACFLVAIINLVLYIVTLPVVLRNVVRGGVGEHFYRNDWRIYKGKLGFIFTGLFSLAVLALLIPTGLECYDIIDTELSYEEYFPYCVRDRYLIDRFCLLSKQETDNVPDWCDAIKVAFANSYLCTEYNRRMRSVSFAALALLFQVLAIACYGQMAYRPWAFAKWKKKKAEAALRGVWKKRRREYLQAHVPGKLNIAQEKKKVKLAKQAKLEQEIRDAQIKRDMDIRLKNVRRRLARRASREKRKELKRKEKEERRLRHNQRKAQNEKEKEKVASEG